MLLVLIHTASFVCGRAARGRGQRQLRKLLASGDENEEGEEEKDEAENVGAEDGKGEPDSSKSTRVISCSDPRCAGMTQEACETCLEISGIKPNCKYCATGVSSPSSHCINEETYIKMVYNKKCSAIQTGEQGAVDLALLRTNIGLGGDAGRTSGADEPDYEKL